MVCESVSFRQFRNIEEQRIEFTPGVNVICGDNAQGKTNALEGIYLCSGGRSGRIANEKELIMLGRDFAEIKLVYRNERERNELLIRYLKNGRKYCAKNTVALRKMSEFIGNFRAVLFCPEDLSLVKEGPSVRRSFLDIAISQLSPLYINALKDYNKALSNRNKMLSECAQSGKMPDDSIDAWSMQLAKNGEVIAKEREEYIKCLNESALCVFSDMSSGKESIRLSYSGAYSCDEYYERLCSNIAREVRQGSTLYGIHKDDFEISVNGLSARTYASQGQQRSSALALKLAEGEISKQKCGSFPVYLLDDVLSELDPRRREYLLSVSGNKQVIITACDKESVRYKGVNFIYAQNGIFR